MCLNCFTPFGFRCRFEGGGGAAGGGSLPEIARYSPYYLSLNVLLLPKDQTFIFYLLEHFYFVNRK